MLNSKTAVITGASRGIGRAIALSFAKNGYNIAAVYNKSEEAANILKNEIEAFGGSVKLYKADVAVSDEVKKAVEQILTDFSTTDVLVNNAGIAHFGLVTDVSEDEYDRIMDVNMKGTFLFTKGILPNMIHNKNGVIINISSMWGQVGASCEAVYSASKAAVIGYTKALAKEVGPSGIRVNCISPGVIDTDMMADFDEQTKVELCEETPITRLGTAEDIANAVEFLASEKASFITGQVISVNGGFVV